MTNGDKLRAMSDADLAEKLDAMIHDCIDCPAGEFCDEHYPNRGCRCSVIFYRWLKEEVKDEQE